MLWLYEEYMTMMFVLIDALYLTVPRTAMAVGTGRADRTPSFARGKSDFRAWLLHNLGSRAFNGPLIWVPNLDSPIHSNYIPCTK